MQGLGKLGKLGLGVARVREVRGFRVKVRHAALT